MSIDSQLRDKLRKVEALFAGAGTAGERLAAEAALARVRVRLAELGQQDPPVEIQFSTPDHGRAICFLPCAGVMDCSPIVFIGNGATPSWCGRQGLHR